MHIRVHMLKLIANYYFMAFLNSEQIAVKRIVINGETAAAVAKELGCTRQSVNQAKQRGLNKLKRNLQA